MRAYLLTLTIGLSLATLVAWQLRPAPPTDGAIELGWTTLFSPERKAQADLYNKFHPGYRIVMDLNYTNLDKILVQASSGVGAALVDVYGPEQLQTLVEAGIAMRVPQPAGRVTNWPGAEALTAYEGESYAASVMTWADIIYCNLNVFAELDIAPPKGLLTWDEFFSLCQKIRTTAQARGLAVHPLPTLSWQVFFASRHGEYFAPDGTRPQLTGAELREAFALHHAAIFTERVALSAVELKALASQPNTAAMFAEGRFAMMIGAKWHLKWFRRHQQLQRSTGGDSTQLRLGVVPIPHFRDCAPAYLIQGRGLAVNALSPVREQAVTVLTHLQSPEHAALINQQLDGLPPNPRYASLDAEETDSDPALAVPAAHAASLFAMAHGYTRRQSPYYLSGDVERLLAEKIQRLETAPSVDIRRLLVEAEAELEVLRERRMRRDPRLAARFADAVKEKLR